MGTSDFCSPDPFDGRDPAIVELVRLFRYDHLPQHLQRVSRPFAELVFELLARLPDGSQFLVALQKLLEAKDAAVRQAVVSTMPRDSMAEAVAEATANPGRVVRVQE